MLFNFIRQTWYRLGSPKWFYQLSGRMLPWLWISFLILLAYGLIGGLWLAPPDYQQGEGFRIIYVHVPAAALSLGIYACIGIFSAVYLIWHIKLADWVAKSSVSIGAGFALLALVTGALWGKPMWGAWWIWDARLTSELILLFLYIGLIALRHALEDFDYAGKACAILALVGLVDLPIVHYSVYWWNTLHQQATLLHLAKPTMATPMLLPLLAMLAAFSLYFVIVLLLRVRVEILKKEQNSQWVKGIFLLPQE